MMGSAPLRWKQGKPRGSVFFVRLDALGNVVNKTPKLQMQKNETEDAFHDRMLRMGYSNVEEVGGHRDTLSGLPNVYHAGPLDSCPFCLKYSKSKIGAGPVEGPTNKESSGSWVNLTVTKRGTITRIKSGAKVILYVDPSQADKLASMTDDISRIKLAYKKSPEDVAVVGQTPIIPLVEEENTESSASNVMPTGPVEVLGKVKDDMFKQET